MSRLSFLLLSFLFMLMSRLPPSSFTSCLAASSSKTVKAIQLDVEPYTLPEWSQNQTQTANYLDMIDKLKALNPPIPLRFATPRWFDGISHTRNGVTKKLSEFIQDKANLMIMDYVNSGTRAIRDANSEVQYALTVGTKVVVGIETMYLPSEPTATYFGKFSQELENDLTLIENVFAGNASYEGVCVHDYKWYKNFTQNFTQPLTGPKRDLYVWDNSVILNDATQQEFITDLNKLKGKLRTIYLESATLVSNKNYWNQTFTMFQKWNKDFQVNIELISGDTSWALPSGHANVIAFVNASIQFYNAFPSDLVIEKSSSPTQPQVSSSQKGGGMKSSSRVNESVEWRGCPTIWMMGLFFMLLWLVEM